MSGWTDRLLAAMGLGGKKPEAEVDYDPGKPEPGRDDTTLGAAPSAPGKGSSQGGVPDPNRG